MTITQVCQHCGHQYILGKTGTVMGCDECLGIMRNPRDGTIIEETFDFAEEEDSLTDMEKA